MIVPDPGRGVHTPAPTSRLTSLAAIPHDVPTDDPLELVRDRLHNVRGSVDAFTACCPAHDDRHASLSVRRGESVAVVMRCFRDCEPEAIVRALGLDPALILGARRDGRVRAVAGAYRPQRIGPGGLTVAELARAKGLPERALRDFGLRDAIGQRRVLIPYRDEDGGELFARARSASKTIQPSGVKLVPYGLDRLGDWRAAATPLAVEGESDCWTAWHHGRAVLGLPGANASGCLEAEHVAGLERLYVLQEPDAGGPAFYGGIRTRLSALGWEGDVYAFALTYRGRRIKDLSDLHLAVGGDHAAFEEALAASLASAVPVDLDADQLAAWADPDDDTSAWPASARARVAELEARITALERGGDGASSCDGACPTSDALREQVAEYKAADRLILNGPFTPTSARVVQHLTTVARAARTNGTTKVALERADVARLALGDRANVKGVSRALKEYKQLQDDPEIGPTLPLRLEWRDGGRRTHIDLYPLTPETPRSRADELRMLGHLPRPSTPPPPIRERDDACPRCRSDEGVESRTTKRCLNDNCGHTWHTRPVILGRAARDDEQEKTTLPLLVGTLPGQIVPANPGLTPAGQFVPANPPPSTLIPVSMVTRDDQLAAKSPHYWGDAPPEDPPPWVPPPIAPSSHIARGFQLRPTPPADGG
jgi:hypothetical protein